MIQDRVTELIGTQLVLYTTCALYLWSQRKTRKRSIFLLAYITLLLVIETMYMVVQANTVQSMYIDNRNFPGGPWAYFLATQQLPINVIFYATLFVLTFLSDLLLVSDPIPVMYSAKFISIISVVALLGNLDRIWTYGCVRRYIFPCVLYSGLFW